MTLLSQAASPCYFTRVITILSKSSLPETQKLSQCFSGFFLSNLENAKERTSLFLVILLKTLDYLRRVFFFQKKNQSFAATTLLHMVVQKYFEKDKWTWTFFPEFS